MDATLAPNTRRVEVHDGLELAIREWPGDGRPFLLVHGLASNARTWDLVGSYLNARGHYVVAVDQRGHGHSDKPEHGYNFEHVTEDLSRLVRALAMDKPVIAGQSWGGNVVLETAVRYPALSSGIIMVDGGFIDLSKTGEPWEVLSERMKPPNLLGTPRTLLFERMQSFHPNWDHMQVEMQMANFETLEDGTIRPWLTLHRHLLILHSLWEQRPAELYPKVTVPALIAAAPAPSDDRQAAKLAEVDEAEKAIPRVNVCWFNHSVHDIHVDDPRGLSDWILAELDAGFFDPL